MGLSIPPLTVAIIYDVDGRDTTPPGTTGYNRPRSDYADAVAAITKSLQGLGHTAVAVGDFYSLVAVLSSTPQPGWDLVMNLAGGIRGVAKEAQVPAILEAYGIPFTFGHSLAMAISTDKSKTKELLDYHGIPTAPFAVVPNSTIHSSPSDRAASAIAYSRYATALSTFPLFAKPVGEHSSRGISPYSKISRPEDLEPVVAKLCAAWPGQDILLERFLGGREFTVALLGEGKQAKVLGTMEMKWGQKNIQQIVHSCGEADLLVDFATAASKESATWDGLDMVEELADQTDPVVVRAEMVALTAWRALQCRDVGRIDLRYDKIGEDAVPYVLEINPICGFTPDWSQLPLIAKAKEIDYQILISMVVENAWARAQKMAKS